MKKIYSFLVAALVTGLLLWVAGCGGSQQTAAPGSGGGKIQVKFSHVTSETSPKGQAALKFKELLEKSGQFEVQVFPSSQLFGDKEELEMLRADNVQFIAPSVTKLVGFVPAFQIVDMPFLFQNDRAAYAFYDGPAGQKLMRSLESHGMLGMAWWINGSKHFTNSKRPLQKPADFKGLKFRTQSGGVLDEQFKALGAGSQTIPFGEVYQALANKTVDGQENTFNNIDTQKYAEVQKYLTISGHGRLDYLVITNTKFWNKLTAEQQKIVRDALQEATAYERRLAEELNEKSKQNLLASGKLQVYQLTPADRQEFIKAMQPVYQKYTDVIGREYIEAAQKSGQ
ncbi:MAG: TRAP transporter substrate-binding protein [Desulfurispora sp.]|uniref:TRAP transporter substrate-binding protein n=1 Tax=Desulfurispora sp. TaxID=3014275 RepID=UPI00404A8F04